MLFEYAVAYQFIACQLRTKQFCTQLTEAYVAETSCISCY